MKLNTKIVLSGLTLGLSSIAVSVLTPAANLAANSVTVNQLAHSDEASYMNTMVGNGSGWVTGIATVIVLILLAIIWTRKGE